MPTGLITEYHADTTFGLIQVDGQADDTFLAFRKADCSTRLKNKLTQDIPDPGDRLHVTFDPGTDPDPDDPSKVLPIAINVDLSGAEVANFGTNNRIDALMAVASLGATGGSSSTPATSKKRSKPGR